MVIHGNEDPPADPVDCHKEISPPRFIGHVWRVFHVNVGISGLRCFQANALKCAILGFTITKASRSMPTQTGSRPERDIVGFLNSRTTANRLFSDSRHVLRSASPPQPVGLWSGWSEDDGGGLRCLTLSRLRHFQTACSAVLWRSAKTNPDSSCA